MSQDSQKRCRCSFCGKTENQVSKLISGPAGIFICDECVEICAEIIDDDAQQLEDDPKCSICGAKKENVQIFFYDDFSDRNYCGRCVDRLSTLYEYNLRMQQCITNSFLGSRETYTGVNNQSSDVEIMEKKELSPSDDIPNDLDELLKILKG